jgi:hypothetical protein
MLVTLDVSQFAILDMKFDDPENIPSMFVTLDVSHADTSESKFDIS